MDLIQNEFSGSILQTFSALQRISNDATQLSPNLQFSKKLECAMKITGKISNFTPIEFKDNSAIKSQFSQDFFNIKSFKQITQINLIQDLPASFHQNNNIIDEQTKIEQSKYKQIFPIQKQNSQRPQKPHYPFIQLIQNPLNHLFFYPQQSKLYNQDNLLKVKIQELAKLFPLPSTLSRYVKLHPSQLQDYKAKKIFSAFISDWLLSQQCIAINEFMLKKIRNNIILSFITSFITNQNQTSKPIKQFNLVTNYLQVGLPVPSQQITPQYIKRLLSKPKIKNRFKSFVKKKLKVSLWEENLNRIDSYTSDILLTYKNSANKTVRSLKNILEPKRKPFSNKQMSLIVKQGKKILSQFSKQGQIKRHKRKYRSRKNTTQNSNYGFSTIWKSEKLSVSFKSIHQHIDEEIFEENSEQGNENELGIENLVIAERQQNKGVCQTELQRLKFSQSRKQFDFYEFIQPIMDFQHIIELHIKNEFTDC